jgi:hypothetical protein
MGRGSGQTTASFHSVLGERRFGARPPRPEPPDPSTAPLPEIPAKPFLDRGAFQQMRRSNAQLPRVARRFGLTRTQLDAFEHAARLYPQPDNMVYRQCLEHLFPPGTRVRLESLMNTGNPPMRNTPGRGEWGTIRGYDDRPKIEVEWDNGSNFALFVTDDFIIAA